MSTELVDRARAARDGEELDEPTLRAYLAEAIADISADQELLIEQFPGGHSNLTYLLRQGDRELVLRRPPRGSRVKSAHDMGREYQVLSKLSTTYAKAPRTLAFCEDEAVIGANFYVMERIRGLVLRKNFPPSLPPTPNLCERMCHSLIGTLAEVHAIDYQDIGLGELGRPEGYVRRQVEGWNKRYQNAKTDDIARVDEVASWLVDHLPCSPAPTLIHNDFKFDNLVLDPGEPSRVLGLLDWEMCTIGDPLMDLGTALAYWVQADDAPALHSLRFGPTQLPGMLSREQLAELYAEQSGRKLDSLVFYYVFGLFKNLGVVQQIYHRFQQGLTRDPRFGEFIHAVRVLSDRAHEAIIENRI